MEVAPEVSTEALTAILASVSSSNTAVDAFQAGYGEVTQDASRFGYGEVSTMRQAASEKKPNGNNAAKYSNGAKANEAFGKAEKEKSPDIVEVIVEDDEADAFNEAEASNDASNDASNEDPAYQIPDSMMSMMMDAWGRKNENFCEICNIDCKTKDAYNKHLIGAKHKKKAVTKINLQNTGNDDQTMDLEMILSTLGEPIVGLECVQVVNGRLSHACELKVLSCLDSFVITRKLQSFIKFR